MQRLHCRVMLAAAILAHTAFTAYCSLSRFHAYKSALTDIGLFQLFLTRIEHGMTPLIAVYEPYVPVHWLGFHFSPILYALLPVHFLFSSPVTLYLIQSIALAGTAWIIFHIAQLRGRGETESLLWSILFLLNPFLVNAGAHDFHEASLAAPIMAGIAYMLIAKRFYALSLLCILLIMTKEHYGIAVFGAGLAWMWMYKDVRRGALLALFGLVSSYVIIAIVIPSFSGAEHPMLQASASQLSRYAWLHLPWNEALSIFYKLMFESRGGAPSGLYYSVVLLSTFLFLPLAGWVVLLPCMADLAANMLSMNPMARGFLSYHSVALIPLLAAAAIVGAEKVKVRFSLVSIVLVVYLPALLFFVSPLRYWEIGIGAFSSDRPIWDDIKAKIPPDAFVSLQQNLGGHLDQLTNVRPFPIGKDEAAFVLLRLEYPYRDLDKTIVSPPFAPLKSAEYVEQVNMLLRDPEWCIVYWHDPMILFERKQCAPPSEKIMREARKDIERLSRQSSRLAKIDQ